MDSKTKPAIFLVGYLAPAWLNKKVFDFVKSRYYEPKEMMNHFTDKAEGRRSEEMNYEAIADGVIAFADSLGLDRFSLTGYCYGGRIAAVTASKYPHRIQDLILIETFFGKFQYDFLDEMLVPMEHIYQNKLTRRDADRYLQSLKQTNPSLPHLINYYIDHDKPFDDITEWRVHYDILSKNYETNLRTLEPTMRFDGPVHIIVAEKTEIKYDISDYFKIFPNLCAERDITILEGVAHRVGIDHPQVLGEALQKAFEKFDKKLP